MIFLERTREGDCQSDQHWNCWKATLGKLLRQGRAHRYHFELNWSYCCIKYSLWTEPDLKLMFDIIISPAASAASHDSYKSCTSRAFEVPDGHQMAYYPCSSLLQSQAEHVTVWNRKRPRASKQESYLAFENRHTLTQQWRPELPTQLSAGMQVNAGYINSTRATASDGVYIP